MEAAPLIQAQGLTRAFGPTVAVEGVDLQLRQGEILGLLGPNGAGKSTTMKMLTGCLAPSAGSVAIGDFDLRTAPVAAKRKLGYLPEQPPLYPELCVDEYLGFAARLHGVPRGEREAALERAKNSCGLQAMGRRLVGNLSKGYQQRVGLAQAIIHSPEVIVLDEPTVGLDPIQIREIRALITELGRKHSVLLSSHILPEIQAICDRVMIINRGRVVYSEDMATAMRPSFSSAIIGLRKPPEEGELAALEDVEAVEALGAQRFRLRCRTDTVARERWAATAASEGWGLFELQPELRTLEDIFVALTSGSDAEAKAPAREAA